MGHLHSILDRTACRRTTQGHAFGWQWELQLASLEVMTMIACRLLQIGLVLCMLVMPCSAQVQPGSTGGSIGKTDKSVSGGEGAAAPRALTKSSRPIEGGTSDRSSGASVAGRWRWNADCPSGHWQGQLDLAEASRGQFSGSFAGTGWVDIGTITNGQVHGTSVNFTRTWSTGTQYWKGQLAAGRLKGTLSGNENCNWEASRK